MVPWPWLLTCGCVLVGSVYGIEAIAGEGPEQQRAVRKLVGIVCGYLVIQAFL